jgi:hypothetical protein
MSGKEIRQAITVVLCVTSAMGVASIISDKVDAKLIAHSAIGTGFIWFVAMPFVRKKYENNECCAPEGEKE